MLAPPAPIIAAWLFRYLSSPVGGLLELFSAPELALEPEAESAAVTAETWRLTAAAVGALHADELDLEPPPLAPLGTTHGGPALFLASGSGEPFLLSAPGHTWQPNSLVGPPTAALPFAEAAFFAVRDQTVAAGAGSTLSTRAVIIEVLLSTLSARRICLAHRMLGMDGAAQLFRYGLEAGADARAAGDTAKSAEMAKTVEAALTNTLQLPQLTGDRASQQSCLDAVLVYLTTAASNDDYNAILQEPGFFRQCYDLLLRLASTPPTSAATLGLLSRLRRGETGPGFIEEQIKFVLSALKGAGRRFSMAMAAAHKAHAASVGGEGIEAEQAAFSHCMHTESNLHWSLAALLQLAAREAWHFVRWADAPADLDAALRVCAVMGIFKPIQSEEQQDKQVCIAQTLIDVLQLDASLVDCIPESILVGLGWSQSLCAPTPIPPTVLHAARMARRHSWWPATSNRQGDSGHGRATNTASLGLPGAIDAGSGSSGLEEDADEDQGLWLVDAVAMLGFLAEMERTQSSPGQLRDETVERFDMYIMLLQACNLHSMRMAALTSLAGALRQCMQVTFMHALPLLLERWAPLDHSASGGWGSLFNGLLLPLFLKSACLVPQTRSLSRPETSTMAMSSCENLLGDRSHCLIFAELSRAQTLVASALLEALLERQDSLDKGMEALGGFQLSSPQFGAIFGCALQTLIIRGNGNARDVLEQHQLQQENRQGQHRQPKPNNPPASTAKATHSTFMPRAKHAMAASRRDLYSTLNLLLCYNRRAIFMKSNAVGTDPYRSVLLQALEGTVLLLTPMLTSDMVSELPGDTRWGGGVLARNSNSSSSSITTKMSRTREGMLAESARSCIASVLLELSPSRPGLTGGLGGGLPSDSSHRNVYGSHAFVLVMQELCKKDQLPDTPSSLALGITRPSFSPLEVLLGATTEGQQTAGNAGSASAVAEVVSVTRAATVTVVAAFASCAEGVDALLQAGAAGLLSSPELASAVDANIVHILDPAKCEEGRAQWAEHAPLFRRMESSSEAVACVCAGVGLMGPPALSLLTVFNRQQVTPLRVLLARFLRAHASGGGAGQAHWSLAALHALESSVAPLLQVAGAMSPRDGAPLWESSLGRFSDAVMGDLVAVLGVLLEHCIIPPSSPRGARWWPELSPTDSVDGAAASIRAADMAAGLNTSNKNNNGGATWPADWTLFDVARLSAAVRLVATLCTLLRRLVTHVDSKHFTELADALVKTVKAENALSESMGSGSTDNDAKDRAAEVLSWQARSKTDLRAPCCAGGAVLTRTLAHAVNNLGLALYWQSGRADARRLTEWAGPVRRVCEVADKAHVASILHTVGRWLSYRCDTRNNE
jgi:hypothetical protein